MADSSWLKVAQFRSLAISHPLNSSGLLGLGSPIDKLRRQSVAEPNTNDGIWVLDEGCYAHFQFSNKMPSNLLRYMIRHPHELVSRDDILAKVWNRERHTENQARLPENHFTALRAVLGVAQVPMYAGGYQIAPRGAVGITTDNNAPLFVHGSSPHAQHCELRVFPTPVKLHPRGHVLSKLDSGRNDTVTTDVYVYSKIECSNVKVIPYEDEDWSLKISFSHKRAELPSREDEEESYWYAAIGLAGIAQDGWRAVNLSGYRVLRFDARATSQTNKPIPLRVRLKDQSETFNLRKQYQQSTSWSKTFHLVDSYPERSFEVILDDLDWTATGWTLDNTTDVKRSAIHHLLIGHDYLDPSMEGTIFLRNIRFEVD